MSAQPPVGIDLGTTYSLVATVDPDGRPRVLPNPHGELLTPSVVCFKHGSPVVGADAKSELELGTPGVAAFFKRQMGTPGFKFPANGRTYTPVELSAFVLKQLKADAEAALGHPVRDAVITVPAYFRNPEREATVEAGKLAGLNVLQLVNEPTAAAIAFGFSQTTGPQRTLLVYDLGGGTFDVTLLRLAGADSRVLTSDGDSNLGGKDWDQRIVQFLASRFKTEFGSDPLRDAVSVGDLLHRAEAAKKLLTSAQVSQVTISHDGDTGKYELSREKLEELTRDLLDRTLSLVTAVLKTQNVAPEKLDGILLVGGSTRMPMVRAAIEHIFGKPPMTGVHPDQAVALGAALCAADQAARRGTGGGGSKSGTVPPGLSHVKMVDVVPHSLGMVTRGDGELFNTVLLKKDTPLPVSQSKVFQVETTAAGPNQLDVYMLQGDHRDPKACLLLGKYSFSGVAHTPGLPALVEIEYGYDPSGVVSVAARQKSTGKSLARHIEAVSTVSGVMRSPAARGLDAATPYTAHAGQNRIPGAVTDSYGNALGGQYDLARDGAFAGLTVAVLHLYTGEGFDFVLPTKALKEKGFAIKRWTRPPHATELADQLESACQLWIISDRHNHLDRRHLRVIREFFESGRGLYLWGDNDPYYADANQVASDLFGCALVGNSPGNQVVGMLNGGRGFATHLITTGIEYLFEGVTISAVRGGSGLFPLVRGSDGNVVTAVYEAKGRRAIIDGGSTRLFLNWDTAGTGRYVKNAASWLVNYERRALGAS